MTEQENSVQEQTTEVEMEQNVEADAPKAVHHQTVKGANLAVARKEISADSCRAVIAGEISLAEAKSLGRDHDRHGMAVGKASSGNKTRTPKKDRSRECMCSCGRTTNGRFAMGHDARVKGWIVRAVREDTFDQLDPEIRDYAAERDFVRQTEQRMADEEAKRQESAAKKATEQRAKEGEQEK